MHHHETYQQYSSIKVSTGHHQPIHNDLVYSQSFLSI
jgi:hypothetical protein